MPQLSSYLTCSDGNHFSVNVCLVDWSRTRRVPGYMLIWLFLALPGSRSGWPASRTFQWTYLCLVERGYTRSNCSDTTPQYHHSYIQGHITEPTQVYNSHVLDLVWKKIQTIPLKQTESWSSFAFIIRNWSTKNLFPLSSLSLVRGAKMQGKDAGKGNMDALASKHMCDDVWQQYHQQTMTAVTFQVLNEIIWLAICKHDQSM